MPNDRAPQPGSQSALRQQNQQRLLNALAHAGELTQAELARATGLSRATVSNLVKILEREDAVITTPTTSSGRRARAVRLADNATAAIGVDIGRSHLRIVLASPQYHVLQEKLVPLEVGYSAQEAINICGAIVQELLVRQGLDINHLLGAGVGIPGPIDHRTGTVLEGTVLPEWTGIDAKEQMEDSLGVPAYIDNDANLGALAEISWGPHQGCSELIYVKIGSGIGSGLILRGSPYYGSIGVAGEIGHATIRENGAMCRCGNRGCLETIASISTMIRHLSPLSSTPVTAQTIVQRARDGDVALNRVLEDAGLGIGQALANVANLINPQTIVVGGPLHELGEILLEPISRGLSRHTLPVVSETTEVVMSSLADRAEVLGAAALVLQRERKKDTTSPLIHVSSA